MFNYVAPVVAGAAGSAPLAAPALTVVYVLSWYLDPLFFDSYVLVNQKAKTDVLNAIDGTGRKSVKK